MKFFKKRKIKRIRAEIVEDNTLLLEQKEYALARLDEKERAIFQPEAIANQTQAVFENLMPTIVGRVQLKRLQTRNDMIREMRTTLNELAETKKSWVRLKNIDAEIAVEQALAYQEQLEKEATHHEKMAGLERGRIQVEQDLEESKLSHKLRIAKLKAEFEDFEKSLSTEPEKPKSHEEQLAELERKHEFERRVVEMQLEIKELENSKKMNRGDELNQNVLYAFQHTQIIRDGISHGTPKEEIRLHLITLDQEHGKNRGYDLNLDPEDWVEIYGQA